MLELVRDPSTGAFLGPANAAQQEEQLEQFYAIPQHIREAEQDAHLAERLESLVTAVVDTGMAHDHPLLKDRIVADIDLTGEGGEDRHGHGTVVSLLISAVRYWPLLNVKVISATGYGSSKALARALDAVRDFHATRPGVLVVANLSLGIYSRRWLFFRCRGGCRVCRAARRLADSGVQVVAAAGNTPRKTACPATLAVRRRHARVFAVDAPDVPTSGIGSVHGSGRIPPFQPIA